MAPESSEARGDRLVCPKCSGQMEPGFLADRAGGAADLQARWIEGEAAPPNTWFHGVNLQGRVPIPVTTFPCQGCGYLESYA